MVGGDLKAREVNHNHRTVDTTTLKYLSFANTFLIQMADQTPVFLLKTRSSPVDSYEKLFSVSLDGQSQQPFQPIFVPVMDHCLCEDGMATLSRLLKHGKVSSKLDAVFGGLVFTSQRATEAFASVAQHLEGGTFTLMVSLHNLLAIC